MVHSKPASSMFLSILKRTAIYTMHITFSNVYIVPKVRVHVRIASTLACIEELAIASSWCVEITT